MDGDVVTLIGDVRKDFALYARRCLKIIDKAGSIVPLELNRAQRYIHDQIEDQIARTGMARKVILKGRQQGASTYIAARFYWKASGEFGKRVQIMTHLDEATDNIFSMVKRYHDYNNLLVKPSIRISNRKELEFKTLKTRYRVTTAGSKGTGRGATVQYFHWSEMAFSPAAHAHMAGIGQTVPDKDGTEILIESTANGINNPFHSKVMEAMSGRGPYELIFVPWFWEDGYSSPCPAGFSEWTDEEVEYKETYGCTWDQLYWRHSKIISDFDGDETLFDQEYPADIAMAFAAGTKRALIKPPAVARAMRRRVPEGEVRRAPLILGIDPGEYGDDPTGFTLRRGRRVERVWEVAKEGNAQIAGRALQLIAEHRDARDPIDAVMIDVTGVGTGVEAFISDANPGVPVYRIHFGGSAIESEKYTNRAAEMYAKAREALGDEDRFMELPPTAVKLQAELCSRQFDYDGRRRLRLETKEQMRKAGKPSPNLADSFVLTFAVPVIKAITPGRETLMERLRRLRSRQGGGSPGMRA